MEPSAALLAERKALETYCFQLIVSILLLALPPITVFVCLFVGGGGGGIIVVVLEGVFNTVSGWVCT